MTCLLQSPLPVGVGTLNAAQTQYLSQLTAQSENLKSAVGIGSGNIHICICFLKSVCIAIVCH